MCIESPNKVPGTLLSCDGGNSGRFGSQSEDFGEDGSVALFFSSIFSLSLKLNIKKINWEKAKGMNNWDCTDYPVWMDGWNVEWLCNWSFIHSCVRSSVICSLEICSECLCWIPFCLSALQPPSQFFSLFPCIPCWDLSSNLVFSELSLLATPQIHFIPDESRTHRLGRQNLWLIYYISIYLLIPLNCKPYQGGVVSIFLTTVP